MPIFYTSTGSFDFLEVTSSFTVGSSATVKLGSNNSAFTGSFSGSFVGDGSDLTGLSIASYKTTISSPTLTGTVSNTLVTQSYIPANTFGANSIVEVRARVIRTTTAGSTTLRIYTNTSSSLSGATQVGTALMGAGITYAQISRYLAIRTSTNTEVYPTNTSVVLDDTSTTTIISFLATNWSLNQFIIFAIQPGNSNDTAFVSYYRIFAL